MTSLTLTLKYQSHHYIQWRGGMGTFSYSAVQCTAFHARNLKYTAMHQQHYLGQSANTQENIDIQPFEKIWKMESDAPHSIDKV